MTNGFDIASVQYDTAFTFSKIGKAQRQRVFKYLRTIINTTEKLSILELNCGTGEDAIQFARLGHKVLATDVSTGMIKVAKAKSHSKNIEFRIQDINTLNETNFETKFDMVFSNFGGFNCLSKQQLEAFFNNISQLLNEKGKVILVIMPKHCIWEQIYFTLKGRLKKAKRRHTEQSVPANVDGLTVDTWYYNPEDIVSLAEKDFFINQIRPIGLTIPPSYLESSFLANKLFVSIYKGIDSILTNSFWSKYADHFLIELTKKS
ncbi:class I SAM-dependent methyltransferase [Winogradskyella flava]|uniref:Class I SAM-dependent methyltransferase n=1 Tax=Winogradskyella flava TaxID=1884876 RepID=A0A842IP91_9FLAO|nr:class I SAM-dependent methyltransferase [Winogradskyella flava]MBC2843633.1 class I SAM-dependent methyltransferase [Winogradskyella flava]